MIITKSEPFSKEEIEKRNKETIGALAMDLDRVALGYYRGSIKMAEVFAQEALKRRDELQLVNLKPYIRKFLETLDSVLSQKDHKKLAESALMYSTIFQNAALRL